MTRRKRHLKALPGGLEDKMPEESGEVLKPQEIFVVFAGDPTYPHETFLRRPKALGHAAELIENKFNEVMVGRYLLAPLDPPK